MSKSKPNLSRKKVCIQDERVKWDFEQHDRYQAFSSELMKLAIGAIAVMGFLVTLVFKDASSDFAELRSNVLFWYTAKSAALCLGVSCASALCHKYLASDGMHHHLRAIKLLIWAEENPGPQSIEPWTREQWEAEIETDEEIRNRRFKWSGYALNVSAFFFGSGVLLIIGSLWFAVPKPDGQTQGSPSSKQL